MNFLSIIKTFTYKGHDLVLVEDSYGAKNILIDGDYTKACNSFTDAKRYINGEPTQWEVIDLTA